MAPSTWQNSLELSIKTQHQLYSAQTGALYSAWELQECTAWPLTHLPERLGRVLKGKYEKYNWNYDKQK